MVTLQSRATKMGNPSLRVWCSVPHLELLLFLVCDYVQTIVDVRVAHIRKLAFQANRQHIVTANYNTVFCFYLFGPLDLHP